MNNNKNYRVSASLHNQKSIKLKLKQSYESISVLSLNIYQNDIYPSDNCDFGVLIGRVESRGIGIPNAKVNIFVPRDENDVNLRQIYPYINVNDKDVNGIPYNILPNLSTNPPENQFFGDDVYNEGYGRNNFGLGYKPEKPIGTFKSPEEICTNTTLIDIYEKYYIYTAKTNESGDYCIMGVPTGNQALHIDVDLTDIGDLSMKPVVLSQILKLNESNFTQNGTKINDNARLGEASHVISRNIQVDIKPFWGDIDSRENNLRDIGITRQDFDLGINITPTTSIFFAGITMAQNAWWYDLVTFRARIGLGVTLEVNLPDPIGTIDLSLPLVPFIGFDIKSNKCALNGGAKDLERFELQISSTRIPLNRFLDLDTSDFEGDEPTKNFLSEHRANNINVDWLTHKDESSPQIIPTSGIAEVKSNGAYVALIPCDTKKVITDINGNRIEVPDNYNGGIFTELKASCYAKMDGDINMPNAKLQTDRIFMKIPQDTNYSSNNPNEFIQKFETFKYNKFYSVVQRWFSADGDNSSDYDTNTGMINNISFADINGSNPIDELKLDYPNVLKSSTNEYFGDKNVHFCLYFLQYGYRVRSRQSVRICEDIVSESNIYNNANPLGGGLFNTKNLCRGDNFKTAFIEIPKKDLLLLLEECNKSNYSMDFLGKYYGVDDDISIDPTQNIANVLFFKGLKEMDIVKFMYENNIL